MQLLNFYTVHTKFSKFLIFTLKLKNTLKKNEYLKKI